jgi:hypothetical protein
MLVKIKINNQRKNAAEIKLMYSWSSIMNTHFLFEIRIKIKWL